MHKPPRRFVFGCLVFFACLPWWACSSSQQQVTFSAFVRGASKAKRRLAYPALFGPHSHTGAQTEILSLLWTGSPDPDSRFVWNRWEIQTEEHAAPAISQDGQQLYVGGSNQRLSCMATRTGKHCWTRTLQGRLAAPPYTHKEVVFVGTTSGMIYAIHRKTGKTKWKYQAEGEILSEMAYVEGDKEISPTLFATTGNDQLYALHGENGKLLWRHKHESSTETTLSVRGQSPPTVHKDKVYTGFSDGTLGAFQAGDGSVVWQKSLRQQERFMDIDAPVVIRGAYLYAVSYNTGLHALRLQDGQKLWTYAIQGAGPPTFHEDKLYLSNSEGRVVCLYALSGNKIWEQRYKKAGAFSSIIATPTYLFLSGNRNGLYVLRRDAGHLVQALRLSRGISASPVVFGQRLFVFANSGFVFGFSMGLERNIRFSTEE